MLALLGGTNTASAQQVRFTIDPSRETGALPHFWTSTGFTPPTQFADERMRVQLAHFDGVPLAGFELARVHDLLTLVRVQGMDTDAPTYDWSGLDHALDTMLDAGLRPFFEVMGSPDGYAFTDMRDPVQVDLWRRLVRDLARHLIDRHGREEVRSWYFEVWNEPDVTPWFNHPWAEDDAVGLIRYYDATSAGLMDADPALRFGGPGTAEQLSVMFVELMKHLDTGTNHLTGQSPPRCDFISVHVKGGQYTTKPADPSMDEILDGQRELHDYLVEHHPRLAELPFINNECDPRVGWTLRYAWRTDSYYPTFVARLVHRQLDEMVRSDADFALMSNDHGFLGDWGQRSVMVPFTRTVDDEIVGVSMVKKPVLEGMTLMALLGNRTVAVESSDPAASVFCLASITPAGDLAILVTHHADDSSATGNATVTLDIASGTDAWSKLAIRRIDQERTHPKRMWDAADGPETPSAELLAAMRDAAEVDVEVADVPDGPIEIEVPMHGMALVILSREPMDGPPVPGDVRARIVNGLHGDEVLVRWTDAGDPRRLRGYLVEAATPDGLVSLSPVFPISTTLVRPVPEGTTSVRVTTVDLWDRSSESVSVPIRH
ncbi:MAG: hypothetical protein AAGD32_10520 [Planctomycetota bacterium]